MLNTVLAVVPEGRIELVEKIDLAEGTRLLVTLLPREDEDSFWMRASELALASVWDNPQDDVYADLLKE